MPDSRLTLDDIALDMQRLIDEVNFLDSMSECDFPQRCWVQEELNRITDHFKASTLWTLKGLMLRNALLSVAHEFGYERLDV